MDFILNFLPADEGILRTFGIGISFVFGFIGLYATRIFIQYFFLLNQRDSIPFFVILPFAIPEFLFQSLILNPSNIAIAFTLISAICLIRFLRDKKWPWGITFVLCFSIAIPFRWTIVLIMPILAGLPIIMYQIRSRIIHQSLVASLLIFTSLIISFLWLWVSGFSPNQVVKNLLYAENSFKSTDGSNLGILAQLSSFFTPAVIFTIALIPWILLKSKATQSVQLTSGITLLVMGSIPLLLLQFPPNFKYWISIVPVLIILLFLIYKWLSNHLYLQILLSILIVTPWIFGIKLAVTGTSYGPGFEVQTCSEYL